MFPNFSREFTNSRPKVDLTRVGILHYLHPTDQSNSLVNKTAKKLLLKKFQAEISLQFTVDDLMNPLVTLAYFSSEEEMDIDDPKPVIDAESSDSDIEVVACYSEQQTLRPQTVAGRGMTCDLPSSDSFSLYDGLYGPSTKADSDSEDELINLVLGIGPTSDNGAPLEERPIARCAQVQLIPETPQSPPDHEKGPNTVFADDRWSSYQANRESEQAHITGVAVSTSGVCSNPNYVARSDCYVCGKSFESIKVEITLDYLERTHMPGEIDSARMRRWDSYEAGMSAGSFILIPGGVSQAPACDGNWYQVAPNTCDDLPVPPGVLLL